ncbi:hypothetical protein BP00DRAFT_255530 [Aspergillus indologenus CBS 114.80]|uniref:Uncharacterized protein n=1 Tax=Aspergillus indologenus CBS 114.80 TaxID=1450541 RepID=A0A2V5HY24_9EURO|nr:hypothetical protein BP00DRAFT_255530 [Aspergillus indologenus CBS 114.80]
MPPTSDSAEATILVLPLVVRPFVALGAAGAAPPPSPPPPPLPPLPLPPFEPELVAECVAFGLVVLVNPALGVVTGTRDGVTIAGGAVVRGMTGTLAGTLALAGMGNGGTTTTAGTVDAVVAAAGSSVAAGVSAVLRTTAGACVVGCCSVCTGTGMGSVAPPGVVGMLIGMVVGVVIVVVVSGCVAFWRAWMMPWRAWAVPAARARAAARWWEMCIVVCVLCFRRGWGD